MTHRDDKARVRRCLKSAQEYLDRGKSEEARDAQLHHRLHVLAEAFRHLEVAGRAIDWMEKSE